MADETPTTPSDPQAPSTPAEQPAAAQEPAQPTDVRALPEFKAALTEEVERVFSERLERERGKIRKELRKELRAPTPEQPDETQATETPPEQPKSTSRRSKVGELEQRLEFRDAVAEYGFSRDQRKLFESLYIAANGDDPDEWLSDFVRTAGLGKNKQGAQASPPPTAQTVAPQTAPAPAPAPTGPPASDRGGVTAANNTFAVDDPERWTEDHVTRMIAEARESKEDPGRYIRNKFLAGLRGKTIVFSR